MSLLLVAALTVSGPSLASCSWDRPGANPFMGDVVAAVDRYQDIPVEVRKTLKKRIAARQYDELATIKRDSIEGAYRYTDLRDMHFGKGTICQTVTREKWKDTTQERGLVYCEDGHCLIVPTVCRNVSRITRAPMRNALAEEPIGPPDPAPTFLAGNTAPGELQFEAPSAGGGRSFALGASGASPVLPGGSDAGLASGGGTFDDLLPASIGSGGLPYVPAVSPTFASLTGGSLPGIGGGTSGGGLPGLPGVPGVGPGSIATPIPEPSTYAMLVAGLGLVGWMARRQSARRRTPRD